MLTEKQKEVVLSAVKEASVRWQSSFNSGNAAGCAGEYETSAIMHAKPFGTFSGTSEILGFWQQLIDDGFTDVEYINASIEVVDETSAILTSEWKMNKARGVIHKELWVLQGDGTAKLREDAFEALG